MVLFEQGIRQDVVDLAGVAGNVRLQGLGRARLARELCSGRFRTMQSAPLREIAIARESFLRASRHREFRKIQSKGTLS